MRHRDYSTFGLRVRSDLELPLPPAPTRESDGAGEVAGVGDGGIVITRSEAGCASPGALQADGPDVVAAMEVPGTDEHWYVVRREQDGYRMQVRELGEFTIDAELRHVAWSTPARHLEAMAAVLLAGTVLSLVLTLRGRTLLHASAVARAGRTVAFTGGSGRGKSTVAALCAAAGASIVTDDVLLLDVDTAQADNGPVRCHGGAAELRLRDKARPIADLLDADAHVRETADARLGVRAATRPQGWTVLDAIVVPSPTRERTELTVRRLSATDAVLTLLSFPRVAGLRAPQLHAGMFTALSTVASHVPVYEAVIPWGPPFRAELGAELLETLEVPAA